MEAEADATHGPMFKRVFAAYLAALPERIGGVLHDQHAYTDTVSECQRKAFLYPGKRDAKQKEMTRLLAQLGSELKGEPNWWNFHPLLLPPHTDRQADKIHLILLLLLLTSPRCTRARCTRPR